MEYRKLIKFGNSSHVISIPNTWIQKNNLKKGDTIYLEENGNNELIVLPKEIIEKKEEKIITINTDGKDPKFVNREIVTAYLNDFNIIKITGKNIPKFSSSIKERVQNLMACEIMEHNHEYIICRDFLNLEELSYKELLRKMDNTVRSMIYDLKHILEEKNDAPFVERSNGVNRVSFVISRMMRASMNNASFNKKLNTNSFEVLQWWFVALKVEYISEGLRNIAMCIFDKRLNKEAILRDRDYLEIVDLFERLYVNVMKSFYEKDYNLAMAVSDLRYIFNERCDKLQSKYKDNPYMGVLLERFLTVVKLINIMARWVFSN